MLIVFLYIVIFPIFASSQFLSYDAVRMRVPGRCSHGDFDCGLSQCVPISQFRDGKPDCMDGSDEWCFIGQVSCGPVYCADYKDALACIVYPKCDGSSKQLPWCSISKEKLCADKRSFPCKGYGECVLWEWLMDGKKDCIDGSDEDENYVMPLENAFRMERNRTGLVLPQPIPPPPEDHPSLYVKGCSFCPNAGSPSPRPHVPESVEMTTPKDPFAATVPLDKTSVPLSNFPNFPTEDTRVGEFFPGITFSKVTKQSPLGEFFPTLIPPSGTIATIPPPPITQNHIYPESVRIITLPSPLGAVYPKPPLIFPPSTNSENTKNPDPHFVPITKSTQQSNMGNWPIPVMSTVLPLTHENTYQPITYPSIQGGGIDNRIPPVNPAIIITRPVQPEPGNESPYIIQTGTNPTVGAHFNILTTSSPTTGIEKSGYITGSGNVNNAGNENDSGVGFKPIKLPETRPTDFSSSSNLPYDSNGEMGKKPAETLIPLIPGHLLPTFQTGPPLQHSTPIYYATTTSWPTRKENSEIDDKEENEEPRTRPIIYPGSMTHAPIPTTSTTKSPAFVPLKPDSFNTHHPHWPTDSSEGEGWFEETHPPKITTTTESNKSTKPHSKIIHVGPDGVIQPSNEESGTGVTEGPENGDDHKEGNVDVVTDATDIESGPDHIIHVGSTSGPTTGTLVTATEITPTMETTKRTTKTGGKHEHEEENTCVRKLMGEEENVVCECKNGQFKSSATGKCDESLSLLNVKVKLNSICNAEYLPLESKQRIINEKISQNLKQRSCIKPDLVDQSFIATIVCENCELEEIHRMLNAKTADEQENANITTEALGNVLCDGLDYNHCHVYADCVVDSEGLRYACRCKPGTVDISNGYGRNCEGFPEDSDCVMVFGICLIVWLLFLLGVFMLTCLCCLATFFLCRKRCCGNVAIHPASPDGLQRVVISSKAKRTLDASEKLPHMRALFAETLKHSAKGSTSVANAFAFADFRRKKVSKSPEMSQVIEENLSPSNSMTDVRLPEVHSLPKVSSLAKLSTHTTVSEPATPAGIIETPILEKNASSVSLISANAGNDNSPQLPSLPLPLPVPIKTNTPTTNVEDKKDEPGSAKQSDGGSQGRPSSSNSIGVQPTIWETYRVLGQQYSKSDPNERKPSVDSLEMMFEARLAETARTGRTNATGRTDASENSPITFIAKPTVMPEDNGVAKLPAKSDIANDQPTTSALTHAKDEVDEQGNARPEADIEKNLEDAAEKKQNDTNSKVADMIGVTSYHVPRGASNRRENEIQFDDDVANQVNINGSEPSSLDKSLEAALLIEMAKRGIELPLSPKTPIPTSDEAEKVEEQNKQKSVDQYEGDVDLDMKPSSGKKIASRKSSAKSTTSGHKTKIPSTSSASQSRHASATSKKSIHPDPKETPVFTPSGARGGKLMREKSFLKRGAANDGITSTDESDPEIAFFKRLEAMREDIDRYQVHPPNQKYSRRRKPERTLSSISEKSAEVTAEAGIDYPVDTSISCPATTRSYLEPKPIPRYFFKRKVIEASGESSDVDIPKSSKVPAPPPPVMNSPDIPDVSFRRSRENLQRLESPSKEMVSPPSQSHLHSRKSSRAKPKTKPEKEPRQHRTVPSSNANSQRSSRMTSRVASPVNGDDAASHTSRSTRHSVISRKIAIRKHELKAVSGSAHDLSQPRPSRTGLTHSSMRSAKSVGDISRQRPAWDISSHRESLRPTEFLPPIVPARGVRTTVNSPQPRHRRSDSHYSLASLPASHSPTSFWSSPYFNPSEDSKKPPKEDLWWNPNKNL